MMDAPHDRSCKKNLDSASSSGDQIRTPLPSAASVSTRPPPKNAQEKTTKAQKETNEKAQSHSRRFSSGRKRSEDKSTSSMGTTSQTEVLNKTLSNDVRDDAAEKTREQDGTGKKRKRRPRTRREENCVSDAIKSDHGAASQKGLHVGATGEESRNHGGSQIHEQGHPQEIPEATKSVAVKGIDDTLSKNGLQNDVTGEENRSLEDGIEKQRQIDPQNKGGPTTTAATEGEQMKVSQNTMQVGATGEDNRKQDTGTQTQGRNRRRNRRAASKSVDAITSKVSTSSQNGAMEEESRSASQDKMTKHGNRSPQNRNESNQTVSTSSQVKKVSRNGEPNGATGEDKSQDALQNQGQRGAQNISETSKAGAAKNQEKKLSQNKSQDEIPKQSQRGAQTISETKKTGAANSQEKKLSPNKSQDEIPKQNQRGAQNLSEAKKAGAAKSQEKKLSQNKGQGEIPKQSQRGAQNISETNKAGAAKSQEKKLSQNKGQGEIPKQNQRGVQGISETDKAGAAKSQEKKLSQNKGQGEIPKQNQRGAQNISETKKTGAAKSQEQNEQNSKKQNSITNITDAAKSQNEPPNCATVKGRSQDNIRKQELRRPRSTRNVNTKVLVKSESALSQSVPSNGATEVESGSQDGTRKGKQIPPRERLKGDQVIAEHNIQNTPSIPNNTPKDTTGGETKVQGRVSHAQDLEKTVQERKCEVLDISNSSSQNEVQVRTAVNNATENRSGIVADKDPRSSKRKAKKTSDKAGSQLKNRSLEAMRDLLNKSPEDIVNWLTSEHSFLFKNQHKVKDEAVIVLVKLLAKACDCESHSDLTYLFSILSNSWFLTRRVGPFLDQLVTKKSKKSQTKHLETIRDTAKVLTEIVTTFPNGCSSLPLVKLHTAAMRLANSGKLLDKKMISTVQELMRVKKKEEITKRKQNAVQRSPPIRAAITDDNREPPENFRELSIIPTREDIIARQDQDQELFLRKNKIQGHYNNEEHYLDVQFRLLREDFLRPLRDGIQQLMAMDSDSSSNDRLQDVRVYENVRILNPVCTSNGVAYKIRFDIASFHRVQWENSKRLIFGSLLCLSKDYFKSFAFAIVANREIQDIRKGEIEVRFVSPVGEAGLRTGDLCQMVESIAFFEAYRPVLEGLKMIPPGEFPLQRYIVKCKNNVQPPAYLTSGDGQHVVFDFSAIMPNEESHHRDKTPSSACVPERRNHRSARDSGSRVSVLDPASWPSAKDLELDESQFNALQLALTKEFAVIQGPPGTGKTYIGLKIAKVLLHNNSAWNKTERPILVVCYTNHALDQFLEGIHAFHPEGIVRVGGRSKSDTIQECSLSKLKQDMIEQRLTPAHIREAYGEIRQEMRNLSDMIESHDGMVEELTRNVLHEDELADYSMTKKHYDSLTRCSQSTSREKRESVIPQWLGLPVQPADPYQVGFAQPLVMFPFNAECWGLEYFSQAELALISPRVQLAPGVDGTPGGSLELAGTFDSFIEIPNLLGGFADAGRSITLLAFIYPTGTGGPIVSYDIYGCGVQLWHDGLHGEMGVLTACFIRRDLMVYAPPLRAPVLNMNEWNLVGASYDHDTGVARLWHNGNEVEALPIGKNFDLATQFSIRVGAGASPWLQYYFTGRISHLHIYAEALTADNIRAVGGIQQGRYKLSMEQLNVDSEVVENNDMMEEDYDRGKTLDFNFDADVMQDQRILDTDAVIRFGSRPPSDNVNADDPYATLSCAEEGVQSGNWQFQNPNRIKKKIKRIIRRELNSEDVVSEEEATKVEDVWTLPEKDRWRLYRRWVCDARRSCYEAITDFQEMFDDKVEELKEVRKEEEYEILKNADVIGMTTTGAARYHSLLQDLQPAITIVEEAAEVLEAHIVTSLTPGCQHLILIGDHQQLRPNPTVYDLQKNYDLDVSLFERMVTNGMLFSRLSLQHRMRPEIAKMLDHIYVEPKLENHESVLNFENIKGVERNLFFVDHNEEEDFVAEGKSRSNVHEAQFLTALCRYLIQQGYEREQITVLTAYSGQLLKLRRAMLSDKTFFEGVRVTAVDNFQGEETDIILLSLVRSERIGFLKIANRVCVALSRARKGFYIIGNATLLEGEDPDLWEKVISDMREQGNLGRHLKLVCQNHPQNVIHASCAEDFEDAPEGGCTEMCGMELDCGHTCDQFCHPADLEHKERFVCQKSCAKTCDLGHNCNRSCGEECGPCMVRVPKLIPGCNHEQEIPCSVDPAKFKCMELVSKQAFPCGHANQVQCSVASSDIVCKEPCGTLECGHPCSGYCNRCQEGRLHLPCQSPCSRTLFCGHKCKDDCVRTCPPCSEPCSNYCDHQQCGRHCGHLCQPCTEECTWQCPHQKCTEPCGEICNRPRCDEPCPIQLPCGHSCVGVCGEVCPKLCRVCDEDEFSESEPGAMFVELIDCGHVFEVKMLDRYMDEADALDEHDNEDVKIKHKECPECNTRIVYARRYGNVVKKILADFEAVKRRTFLSDIASIKQIQMIRQEVREIKGIQKEVLEEIDQSITSGRLTSEEVNKCQNQVTFLKFLGNLVTKYKITSETSSELLCKINILTSRIMRRRDCFSEQELKEFQEELSRTKLLVCFNGLMTALESKSVKLNPEDVSSVDYIRSALDSGEALAHQKRKDFMADINRFRQTHGLSKVAEPTDCGSELKGMIVKTKTLTQGPWYKCNKGHVYSAAECTEDGVSIKCPDCLAASRRTAQPQQEVVPTPMKLSQLMNMTFKHGLVTGAKRKRRNRPSKASKTR